MDVEVKLDGHWFPAKKIEERGGKSLCVVVYSKVSIDHDLLSLNIWMPKNRIKKKGKGQHAPQPSFDAVMNLFDDFGTNDKVYNGLHDTQRGRVGSTRRPTGGEVEGLNTLFSAEPNSFQPAPTSKFKKQRKPTAGGIDTLFGDNPSMKATPASHHGRAPTGNSDMFSDMSNGRQSRQAPSFSGVIALFDGDEDDITEALGKKIEVNKSDSEITPRGSRDLF